MADLRCSGTIFDKSVLYADNVDIIGRSDREVAVSFSKFAEEVRSIGLAVNESKTKYLVSAVKDSIGACVEIDGYNSKVLHI